MCTELPELMSDGIKEKRNLFCSQRSLRFSLLLNQLELEDDPAIAWKEPSTLRSDQDGTRQKDLG